MYKYTSVYAKGSCIAEEQAPLSRMGKAKVKEEAWSTESDSMLIIRQV